MRTLDIVGAQEAFASLFISARDDIFKAEVLQDYSAVDDVPSLHAWIAGDYQKSIKLGLADKGYVDFRNQCLGSPADITRVHVVAEPYTPYMEWEIAVVYRHILIPSDAEKIHLTPLEELGNVKLPTGDFWIFDNKAVLQWEYENGIGKTVGGKVWYEGEDISYFLALREKLMSHATPLGNE